jgi:hypothetical protein
MTTVICWVKPAVGEAKKYKSKNGNNFQDKTGKSYTAPVESKHEVIQVKTVWGKQYWAFYKYGQPNPIPIDPDSTWNQTGNHDNDVDVLVEVTRRALTDYAKEKLERQLTLGGMGLVLLFLLFHHFW